MQKPRVLVDLLLLVVLGLGALGLRLAPAVMTASPTGIDFLDADTVRRLVRLHHLDAATGYPSIEPRDGFPAGTLLQWSLPMDLVIRGLDAVAPPLHPRARRYETGAALAGPVLGTIAVLAFALLARRLLPPGQAAVAAVLYAASAPAIEVTRLGNGDHQSLQDVAAVVGLLGCLVLVAGKGGTALALTAGAALGLSLWSSAESMVLFGVAAMGMFTALCVVERAARQRLLPLLLHCAGACAVLTVVGALVENAGGLAPHWDRVSSFQGAASLALVVFLALARVFDRRWPPGIAMPSAAALAGALLAGPLVLPAVREALAAQLGAARAMSDFAAACVAEYRGLFAGGLQLARLVFGNALFLLPACLATLPWAPSLPVAGRWGLAILALCLGALTIDQVKLAHLFAIPWALVLAVGGSAGVAVLGRRLHLGGPANRRLQAAMGLVLAGEALRHMLSLNCTPPSAADAARIADRREVVAAVSGLEFAPRTAVAQQRLTVMAPWDLGHYLLYESRHAIVASSYQRRVDGIRDSFDVLCSTTPEQARAILQRCRSRWWVRPGDPSFLIQAHVAFPGRTELARDLSEGGEPRIGLMPEVKDTFWARTAAGAAVPPWLELVFESRRTTTWWGGFEGRPFRVFRIRYPDEAQ